MAHGHAHLDESRLDAALVDFRSRRGRLALFGLAPFFVTTLVGLIVLWPAAHPVAIPQQFQSPGGPVITVAGTVTAVRTGSCGASVGASFTCSRTSVAVKGGPDRGTIVVLEITPGPGVPKLKVNDSIRLARALSLDGKPEYYFSDFARGKPLVLLGILFAIVVVVVARWRGFAAIVGIGVTFAVLVRFLLPGLLDGRSPLALALVASAAILFPVLYLAHGVNLRTTSALLGTLGSLVAVAVLSVIAIHVTHLTGLGSEENTVVQNYAGKVQITGLILAGFVIGSLGVLNDVTITQASAVAELAATDPGASPRQVYGRALRVGQDHIASSVYTLVLAYAGSALPILLIFSVGGRSGYDVLTSDIIAGELVRSLVGGIGLALSVPLTTGLAAVLIRPRSADQPALA